jgi:pimeloyl-ACP methyl ester carboxylesterase
MKRQFSSILFTLLFVVACAAFSFAQSMSGDWEISLNTPIGPAQSRASLKHEGENLSGRIKTQFGEFPISGTLKGADVTLKYTISADGNELTVTLKGKLDGDTMKGSADFGSAGEGDWTAKKVKVALASSAAAQGRASVVQPQAAGSSTQAGRQQKTTFHYATKGTQKLYLDRIVDTSVKVEGKRPVIIHSVGGGWESGRRDEPIVMPFLNYLASLGYTVISIDYRLGIKIAKSNKEFTPTNGVEMYLRAIQWAVEDLFDATSYVLKHADAWNLAKDQIVILGGSAGATNSLVAEYNVANDTELARAHLPEGFRYAGVISMAGAFWLKANTELTFKSKPAPIMFFHGGKDQLVTYDEVQGPFSGYGPVSYFRKFAGPDYPKWFVDFPEGDHAVSGAPMIDNRHEVASFLQKLVRERQEISVHMIENDKVPKTLRNFVRLYGDRMVTGAEAPARK